MSASSSPGKQDKTTVVQNGTANPPKSPTKKTSESIVSKSSSAKKTSKPNKGFLQKSPEDMYDEILELKKSMALLSEENSSLKAKIRRADEEVTKKNEDLKRALGEKKSSTNVVVNNLKQKVFKLEQMLKEKENALKKLQSDNKSTKIAEMKIQMDTYYKEILRLKNLSNFKESAKTANDEMVQKILIANKELEEENASLKKDLERALAVNGAKVKQDEYSNMSRTQLIAIISELDNKINTMKDNLEKKTIDEDLKLGEHQSLEELTAKVEHFKNKYTNLENTVQRLREDRLHYHELAESREQELKALRMLIDQMQKQVEQKPTVRKLQSNLRLDKGLPSSGSETDPSSGKSPAAKPNVFDRLTKDAKTFSTRTFKKESAGSESESPYETKIRKHKTPVQNVKEKNAARGAASRTKLVPNDNISKAIPSPMSKSPNKPPASPFSNRQDLVSKSRSVAVGNREGRQKPKMASDLKKPSEVLSTVQTRNVKEPEINPVTKTTSFSSKPEVTKEKISITEENFSSVSSENITPVNKTVTYTVLKTVGNTSTSPNKNVPVDRRTSLSDTNIRNFRQNVAAKKIQKMWKHHQQDIVLEQQRQKVHTFRVNKAARTIQRGWKKHTGNKNNIKKTTPVTARKPQTTPTVPSVNEMNLQHELNLAEASQQFDPLNPFYEDDIVVINDELPVNKK